MSRLTLPTDRPRSEIMLTRRTSKLSHLLALPALTLLAACQATTAKQENKLIVAVRVPANGDNPLGTADSRFIVMFADFLGSDGKPSNIQPYAQGMQVAAPSVPFGAARQIRVDVYNGDTQPTSAIARGATVPTDVYADSAALELHPYVTRINTFAAAFGEPDASGNSPQTELPAAHAATGVATLPNGKVVMAGGAVPKGSAKSAFDRASYASFQSTIAVYDPDTRALDVATDPAGQLATPRAFHTMAVGQTVVAIVGGVEMDATNAPKASNKIEFYNIATGEVTSPTQTVPTMHFGRIAPTVIQMFDHQDYFLILGGQGNEDCPADPHAGACGGNTWEIWHATGGFKAMGQLTTARWHHAGVRVPGPDGGFVMLIGGENTQGAVNKMEVVQFTVANGSVLVSDAMTNCPADCPTTPAGFLWNPVSYDNQPTRIWPAALFVANATANYYHVYMIGGFNDVAHSSANKTVDVFDIVQSKIVATKQLTNGRAAPSVAAVTSGPATGQLLIAGGSDSDTNHLNSGEYLHEDDDGAGGVATNVDPIQNLLGDGGRALGAAVGLNTGHVLIVGGAGGSPLTGRTDVVLWNPNY